MTANGPHKGGRPRGSGTRPVIGVCIATGQKYTFNSVRELTDAGFGGGNVWRCLRGIIKQHAGFVFTYADGGSTRSASKRGKTNSNARIVVGVNLVTGETIRLAGGKEIEAAGFNQPQVSRVARGDGHSHKGYSWRYEDDGFQENNRQEE